jgi:hypothetical protein
MFRFEHIDICSSDTPGGTEVIAMVCLQVGAFHVHKQSSKAHRMYSIPSNCLYNQLPHSLYSHIVNELAKLDVSCLGNQELGHAFS